MSRIVSMLEFLVCVLVALLLVAASSYGQTTPAGPAMEGVVTDPSGAVVPNALVQLRGPGGEQRATTNATGEYRFARLAAGKYQLRVIAQGFTVYEQRDLALGAAPVLLDVQLSIHAEATVVNVEEEANKVSTDPNANGTAVVLGQKELEALSDDPDELASQLQAMAGPAAGPNGGQIYIDGFTGSNLPAKASIREVRINSNPFSPEYDRPGFGRIEIFTKPGSDKIRGQAFFQFNNQMLNSRSPLLESELPDYQQKFFGFNLTGPIRKNKASFGFDVERRSIQENAFILATTLDDNYNTQTVNQAVVTPQTRTSISPRLDYSINSKNTLVARYQRTGADSENEGTGNFALISRAYNQSQTDHSLQLTETAVLSPKAINETRFQFRRSNSAQDGDNSVPAITVQGAFEGGGAQVGTSSDRSSSFELTNSTTFTRATHTMKWGARLRRSALDDTSVSNFGGSYSFFGGTGPALDDNGLPIAGTSIDLTALERYRRTLVFLAAGYTAAQVRAMGGGASQFTLNAGVPSASISQFDAGLFWNDDWRVRPNITLSYGLRYETQTNISDYGNWSPRLSLAWGIGGGANKSAKTVLRAGAGIFYDRVSESLSLSALRYNGVTQQSYLIRNPDFYPLIPSLESLSGSLQPQSLQYVYSGIQAPRTYQASIGLDRQFGKSFRLSGQFMSSRGVHLLRSRNINAPIDGVYPYGDTQIRMLTESSGLSRSTQFVISPSLNYKGLSLFGFYSLGYGKSNAEGQPADPYNLSAEWGPSGFADVRHRMVIGTSLPLPWKFSVSPFLQVNSGSPYNITTGVDSNNDGFTNERPGIVSGVSAADCSGGTLFYSALFGCLDKSPKAGQTILSRNAGRGPANVNINLRLARTWSFGGKSEANADQQGGPPPGMGGMRGGGPPGGGGGGRGMGGGPPGGGMGGPPGGGPPPGAFGGFGGRRYNLTLSIQARNVINHANYGSPSGDLSSPYFGQYRSLAGGGPFEGSSTYNRKIDVQLRFTF